MYKCIQEIHETFDSVGVKHDVEEHNGRWVINTGMTAKGKKYRYLFIQTDDSGNDVAFRSAPIANFPENKRQDGYMLVNELCGEYRFAKFVLDDDGDLMVEYDFPLALQPIGKSALEILIRVTQILEDCHSRIMQAVWS